MRRQRPGYGSMTILGDALSAVRTLRGVDHVISGPPYFGLGEYPTTPGQMGNMDSFSAYRAAFARFYADLFELLPDDGMLCLNGGRYDFSDVDGTNVESGFEPHVEPIVASGFSTPHRIDQAAISAQLRSMGLGAAADSIDARYATDGDFHVFTKSATPAQPDPGTMAAFIASQYDDLAHVDATVRDAAARVGHPAAGSAFIWGAIMETLVASGRTVCDPFAGVGIVGLLGRVFGRRTICIDVEPTYVCEAIRILASDDVIG